MKVRSQFSLIQTRRSSGGKKARSSDETWNAKRVLRELRRLGSRRNVEGMARFGIVAKDVYGVSKPKLDQLARKIGRNHSLGLELWETGNHDARILAGLIAERKLVTSKQMERWVRDFDNWDVCDGTCCHLFVFAAPAWRKAYSWSRRKKEFEKRAGFALAAFLACHDKKASDAEFRKYLEIIEREAWDERNFVRKAVNWALRNIGKRNMALNRAAIASAQRIALQGSRAARWIAGDALRELKSEAVQTRCASKRENK
jgi:3-methyladenine DNA glycosylase AlkD